MPGFYMHLGDAFIGRAGKDKWQNQPLSNFSNPLFSLCRFSAAVLSMFLFWGPDFFFF